MNSQNDSTARAALSRQIHAETKKVLRQMPSRNRMDFVQLSRNLTRRPKLAAVAAAARRSSLFGPDSKNDNVDVIDSIKRRLDDENIDLTTPDGVERLDREFREMKVCLTKKKMWKRQILSRTSTLSFKRPSLMFSFSNKVKQFDEKVKRVVDVINIWRGPIYRVAGVHGSGVTSYFQFLRWLFWLNLPLTLVILFFVMIPQWLWGSDCISQSSSSASDILTGSGWLSCSALYYGYYTNDTINLTGQGYSLPLAYFFTIWLCYVFCLIAVLFSSLHLYRKNYIDSVNTNVMKDVYVQKIFCGWDFQVRSAKSSEQKRRAFVKDLKEHLVAETIQVVPTKKEKYLLLLRRVGLTMLSLAILVCASLCVYIVSDLSNPFPNATVTEDVVNVDTARQNLNEVPLLNQITLALTVTGINYIIPYVLTGLVILQKYSPRIELYFSLTSDFLLNATTLVTMFYFWSTAIRGETSNGGCWETVLGQQFYRLAVMDFLFFIFFALVFEIGRRFLADVTKYAFLRPAFHVGRNILHLTYVQALCWLGAFFSPMAYFMNTLKFFIYFFVKYICAIYACQPTGKFWRASQTRLVFHFVLCAFLFITVGCVAFANYSLKTSKSCGPLRDYDNDYDVLIKLLTGWSLNDKPESLLAVGLAVLTSEGMVVSLLLIICVVVYWQRRRAQAWSTMVNNMKEQLILESKDKHYLLQIMQKLIEYDLTIRRKIPIDSTSHQQSETVI